MTRLVMTTIWEHCLKLKFPKVDDINARITYLNGDCLLYKITYKGLFATSNSTLDIKIRRVCSLRANIM